MTKYLKELFGTTMLVLLGCGIASTSNTILGTSVNLPGAFTVLTIAISYGLAYYIASFIFNDQGSCTFNPILTFVNGLNKKENTATMIKTIITQLIGGFLGAEILGLILGQYGSLGANGYGDLSIIGANLAQAICIEIITSFILVSVYLKPKSNSINIALTIVLIYMFAIPYTNGGANPARSLGPAILMGGEYLKQAWVFIITPFIGAALAFIISKLISKK